MAAQSVTRSTVSSTTLAPPRILSTGIISARQTSSSTFNTPPQTQTSDYPAASTSARSSSLAKHETDPFTRLSPQAIGGIVFVGALVTVLCLAVSFLLLRRKGRNSRSITTDSESQSTLGYHRTPGRGQSKKGKPRPLALIDQTSNISTDSIRPPSTARCRMTYLGQTSTSPPWSIFLGRGNSSILDWKPHNGLQTPLRLSSDTTMVLDPWIRRSRPSLPPLPSQTFSKRQTMQSLPQTPR
ncbi:hypothetical protein PtA15_7A128 [Puccinia triticina]|nr:uncharacterized protein PtA15_7A128 [Puccinia triticina]WAQ86402.1 hypothetical protein PtA15_7A128 [Puccinia triticina]